MPPKRLLPHREIGNSQDSAFSSNRTSSAIYDSQQSVFSQPGTQDSSLSSHEQNSNKKLSMYEQWLNRRSLYKREALPSDVMEKVPKSAGYTHSRLNSFVNTSGTPLVNNNSVLKRPQFDSCWSQNDLMNKVISTEQDQRDLLEQLSYVFQSCNQEVKSTLNTVREKMEISTDLSHDQFRQTLTSFLDDIWKNQAKIESLLQNQDRARASVEDLNRKIIERDTQIVTLEKQLADVKGNNFEHLAETMKSEIHPALLDLQQKLEEILEWTKDTREWQCKHFDEQKKASELQWKQNLNLSKVQEKSVKALEKRLQGGLSKMQQVLETKQNELNMEIREEIMNCLKANNIGLEAFMKQMTEETTSKTRNGGIAVQKTVLQDAVKKQFEDMSKKLTNIVSSHVTKRDQQLKSMQTAMADSISHLKVSLQSEKCQHACDSDIASLVESRLLAYQSSMMQQLTEMRKHDEIMELKNALRWNSSHAQSEPRPSSAVTNYACSNAQSNLKKYQSEPFPSTKQKNIVSLQSKSDPSPVAMVIPQRPQCHGAVDKPKSSRVPQKFIHSSDELPEQECTLRQRKTYDGRRDFRKYQQNSFKKDHTDMTPFRHINPISKKRTFQSPGDMTQANFTYNRSLAKGSLVLSNSDKQHSECSSPTVSITRMNIKRKIKTFFPYHCRGFTQRIRNKPSHFSPALTLLSEISSIR